VAVNEPSVNSVTKHAPVPAGTPVEAPVDPVHVGALLGTICVAPDDGIGAAGTVAVALADNE
jgi:hypothetical protein